MSSANSYSWNQTHFHMKVHERFCTKIRFETEAKANSEVVVYADYVGVIVFLYF